MSTQESQVFTDLAFYVWRIRHSQQEEWRPEIFFMGSDKALLAMRDALKTMPEEYDTRGQSTRKFLCNPPDDLDVVRYAEEYKVEIEWQIWLIIRMRTNAEDKRIFKLRNKAVTVWLNERTLNQLLLVLENQLNQPLEYPRGQKAPGGLFLATEWFG
ncbi:MAG: hypothetical protein ACFE89_10480 [Candidatus Hodarchaeota archaeon]